MDDDLTVRLVAAQALGSLGDPAVEPLIAALRDEDPTVREAVRNELLTLKTRALNEGRHGDAETIRRAVDQH